MPSPRLLSFLCLDFGLQPLSRYFPFSLASRVPASVPFVCAAPMNREWLLTRDENRIQKRVRVFGKCFIVIWFNLNKGRNHLTLVVFLHTLYFQRRHTQVSTTQKVLKQPLWFMHLKQTFYLRGNTSVHSSTSCRRRSSVGWCCHPVDGWSFFFFFFPSVCLAEIYLKPVGKNTTPHWDKSLSP